MMIYSYYCVDCGRKLDGGNITFNLSRMLGLAREERGQGEAGGARKSENFDDPLTLYATWQELEKYIVKSHAAVPENGNARVVRVTLQDVMEMFAQKAKNQDVKQKIQELNITDIWKGKFVDELKKDSVEENFDIQRKAEELGTLLEANFQKEESNSEKSETENPGGEKTKYYKEILVAPEFIENMNGAWGGNSVYTLRYTTGSLNERHLEGFRYAGKGIRGYCPICHAPVLQGTGKYRHLPIGFIGGFRAGKTSLIIAMLFELQNNLDSGLPNATVLADSRIENLKRQQMLYQKGWQIEKTQPHSVQDSFNASVRVKNENGRGEYTVLTLVDIAGELCLNKNGEFDSDAVKKYPLIDQCALYLFCTCISDAGFTTDGGKPIGGDIFPIVNGIVSAFERRNEGIPPFGIVFTKADYVDSKEEENSASDTPSQNIRSERNPFREIKCNTKYFSQGKEMHENLINIFDKYQKERDYKDSLQWACRLFQEYKEKIYMSFFYCTATGKKTTSLEDKIVRLEDISQNKDDKGHEIHFRAAKVDVLLWWILTVTGCVPVEREKGYCCYDVPIYSEAFAMGRRRMQGSSKVRQEWPWEEWKERNAAVVQLFLNHSELDEKLADIIKADREGSRIICALKKVFGITMDRKFLKEVTKYITKK